VAIVDTFRHRGPTRYAETWMPMEEVLQRVVARFPLAVIDRERADRHVLWEVEQMMPLYGPTSDLVELHRNMIGHVAYVTIREEVGGPQFHFFLRQCPTSIDIEYEREEDEEEREEERKVCRDLLEKLAAALPEYDLVSEDPEAPRDLTPDDMPAAVRDAISEMHVRWEADVAILAAGPHEAGEPFPQTNGATRHWCDDSTFVILDLTGFAPVPKQSLFEQALLEWITDIEGTAEGRGVQAADADGDEVGGDAEGRDRVIRLVIPPGTVDERLTKHFMFVGVPIYATLAEALADREEPTE